MGTPNLTSRLIIQKHHTTVGARYLLVTSLTSQEEPSNMSFKLRPAVEDDCIHMSRIVKVAFPRISAVLFPTHLKTEENKDEEVTWRAGRTLARMKHGMPTVVAVEVDENTGAELKVVAFSQWQRPGSSDSEPVQQLGQVDQIVPRPSGMDKRASDEVLEVMHDQQARVLGSSAPDTWCEFKHFKP